MRIDIEEKLHAFVLGVNKRNLQCRMLRCDRIPIKQKHDRRIVYPGAKHRFQREMAPAEIILQILRLHRMRAFKSDLGALVAHKYLGNVAFFCEFDALLVRKLSKGPEWAATPRGTPGMKAIASSLLLAIADRQPCLATKGFYTLLNNRLCLVGVLHRVFVESDGRVRGRIRGRILRRLWKGSARGLSQTLGPERTHHHHQKRELFHSAQGDACNQNCSVFCGLSACSSWNVPLLLGCRRTPAGKLSYRQFYKAPSARPFARLADEDRATIYIKDFARDKAGIWCAKE